MVAFSSFFNREIYSPYSLKTVEGSFVR